MNAYHSAIGIQAVMLTDESRGNKFIFAENSRSYILKHGTKELYNNVMRVTNSYITSLARPDCFKCYVEGLNPYCKNTFGFQLGTVSTTAAPPISRHPSTYYDLLTSA
jgi:hypothetical protein